MAEKHELLQKNNSIQLIDFITAIQPISKTYSVLYSKQANNTEQAYLLGYRKVVIELREAFVNLLKVIPSSTTRGSIFNVDFVGESEEDISITTKGLKRKSSRKRVGINLTKETSSKKSKNLKCLACDIRGYTLPNCQYLFKCKRPKGFKAIGIRIRKVLIKAEYNKDLAT